jgi:hypothetical protein
MSAPASPPAGAPFAGEWMPQNANADHWHGE